MFKKLLSLAFILPLILSSCQKETKDTKPPVSHAFIVVNRAVLTGINEYVKGPLNGCVNDVLNMKKFLIEAKHFKENEITILIDKDATKENIVAALNKMTSEVTANGKAYFHYSGHGTQIPAVNDASEIDGLYEAMCPYDFEFTPEGEAVNAIIDKELVSIFSKFKEGVIFNWSSDSCFSGDLDRKITALDQVKNLARTFPLTAKVAAKLRIARNENPQSKVAKAIDETIDVGFVSGCRSDQTSADTSFNNQPEGAFTHYFIETLKEVPASTTIKVVSYLMQYKLRLHGYDQRPQAEGTRANKAFLAP